VWEQYDTMVQTQTEVLPGRGDAAVLAIRDAAGARIAATTDCNPRFVYLDPFVGAQIAVAEAARNLSCVGAVAQGGDGLPELPVARKARGLLAVPPRGRGHGAGLRGVGTRSCRATLSFYNEDPRGRDLPDPDRGMVGVFDETCPPLLAFKATAT
jgi:phosphoribosylformylglycinamidine synthase